jgi:hypothetical protein
MFFFSKSNLVVLNKSKGSIILHRNIQIIELPAKIQSWKLFRTDKFVEYNILLNNYTTGWDSNSSLNIYCEK